jgi:hypothetical protein
VSRNKLENKPHLLVQTSSLDKFCNLVFARLIGIRLPDFIQRYQLLCTLHNSLDIYAALSEPVHQFLYPRLHALSAARVAQRLERVVHPGCIHLRTDGFENNCQEHGRDGDDMRCVEEWEIGKVVVVDDGPCQCVLLLRQLELGLHFCEAAVRVVEN